MNLGFAVDHVIRKMKREDVVTLSQINVFRQEAQQFITSMLGKFFERSPLGSLFLKSASVFDPLVLRDLPREKIKERWKSLLKCLIDLGILSPQHCDLATNQFNTFVSDELVKFQVEFDGFAWKCSRLDEFYFGDIGIDKYDSVAFVLRLLLTSWSSIC